MALVNEVRELKQDGLSKREISRHTGLVLQTINRYLGENLTLGEMGFSNAGRGEKHDVPGI